MATVPLQPFGVLYFPPTPPSELYPGANALSKIPVRDIISATSPVEWINNTNTCVEAAQAMLNRNVGLLPVKDSNLNYLVGVITDRDLITRVAAKSLDPSKVLVGAVMTAPIIAMIYDDADLTAAERLMIDRSVRRLIVLRRQDNAVIGVLSIDDFARAGHRRRAGEIIKGSSSLAVEPESVRSISFGIVGEGREPQLPAKDVHESIFKVRDIMSGLPEGVLDMDNCRTAAEKMLQRGVGILPVSKFEAQIRKICGVITDRDIVIRAMAQNRILWSTQIGEIMTRQVTCVFEDDNLATAERLMSENRVRRLPVLRRSNNELVGMLSVDDIALSASRGRAGRVLASSAANPNQVYQGTSILSSADVKMGEHA